MNNGVPGWTQWLQRTLRSNNVNWSRQCLFFFKNNKKYKNKNSNGSLLPNHRVWRLAGKLLLKRWSTSAWAPCPRPSPPAPTSPPSGCASLNTAINTALVQSMTDLEAGADRIEETISAAHRRRDRDHLRRRHHHCRPHGRRRSAPRSTRSRVASRQIDELISIKAVGRATPSATGSPRSTAPSPSRPTPSRPSSPTSRPSSRWRCRTTATCCQQALMRDPRTPRT